MAKLNQKKRDSMPKSDFAGKGTSFPINDKDHVEKAVQMAKFASPATKAKIKSKAKAMGVNAPSLGGSKSGSKKDKK
jgi:hypothetical protein